VHLLTSESGKAAVHALVSNTATFLSDHETAYADRISEHATRLDALRRQFHQLGLNLVQLTGDELAVTGPGTCGAALPDIRCAALYLRDLRRGTHG
jgi:hypothetical protein